MESGWNMDKKASVTTFFTETIKLGSRDLKLKKETTASFSIQLIRVLNKYQLLHIKMLRNTLKHAKWLEWLRVNKVPSHIESSINYLQMVFLPMISTLDKRNWSQWFTFMAIWLVLLSILLFQCNLPVMGTSLLSQTWWMKQPHGLPIETETTFGSKMMFKKERIGMLMKWQQINFKDTKREFLNAMLSERKLKIKASWINLA